MINKTTQEAFNDLNEIIGNYFAVNKFKDINNVDRLDDFIEIKITVLKRTSILGFKKKNRSHRLI